MNFKYFRRVKFLDDSKYHYDSTLAVFYIFRQLLTFHLFRNFIIILFVFYSLLMHRNPLRDAFQFYELTQVMRHKEDLRSIEAQNNVARGLTTTEDSNLIISRVVQPAVSLSLQ